MNLQPLTTTITLVRRSFATTSASTLRLQDRELRPSVTEILGHEPNGSVAPQALVAAENVFKPVREELYGYEWKSAVSQSGELTLTFFRDRRYAVLSADEEGELVLTLTDRASNEEAEAEVVQPSVDDLKARIRGFLER